MTGLLAMLALGWGVCRCCPAIWPALWPLRLALVWFTGASIAGWLTMVWSLGGGRPGLLWACTLTLLGVAGATWGWSRTASLPGPVAPPGPPLPLPWRLGAAIAFGGLILVVGGASLGKGWTHWDTIAIWGLKAKVLAAGEGLGAPIFTAPELAWNHPRYPLLWPAQMALCLAQPTPWSQETAVLLRACHYAALLVIAHALLRPLLGPRLALALTLLLGSTPMVLGQFSSGYADMILATYLALALYAWRAWLATPSRAALALATGASLALALTKSEGLPMAVFTAAGHLLLGVQQRWRAMDTPPGARLLALARELGPILLVGAALWLPPSLALRLMALPDANPFGSNLTPAVLWRQAEHLPVILRELGHQFTRLDSWGGMVLLVALAAALGWRAWKEAETLATWAVLAAQLSLFILAYWVTVAPLRWHLDTSIERLLAQLIPLLLLLAALHLRQLTARPPTA